MVWRYVYDQWHFQCNSAGGKYEVRALWGLMHAGVKDELRRSRRQGEVGQ